MYFRGDHGHKFLFVKKLMTILLKDKENGLKAHPTVVKWAVLVTRILNFKKNKEALHDFHSFH
ncbi:MAG: hypothetical protein ACI9DJ_001966 [Algoriphagus sp.]|jgi:hypothetical protein